MILQVTPLWNQETVAQYQITNTYDKHNNQDKDQYQPVWGSIPITISFD